MAFEVNQVELGNEDFDTLFGNKVPDRTVNANTVAATVKPEETETPEEGSEEEQELSLTDQGVDVDELLGVKPTAKPKPVVKPTAKPEPKPTETVEEEVEEEETPAPANEDERIAAEGETEDDGPVDFKSVTDLLIEEGIWEDFEERDKIDYDAKTFTDLWKNQALSMAEGYFNELVDQSGPYGKAVLDHIKKGGNPEAILELFRENKRIQSLDISTPDTQESIVREYYKTLNWSREKIEKEINRKKEDMDLEDEATFAKSQMEERVQKEVQTRQKSQEYKQKEQQEIERQFADNITTTLKNRTDLDVNEKRDALKALLNYDKKLEDGRYVNQFYIDFTKMQADPNSYIDLVMFVRDKNKFLEKAVQKGETRAAKKTFNLIRENGAISNKKDSGYVNQKTSTRNTKDLVIPVK